MTRDEAKNELKQSSYLLDYLNRYGGEPHKSGKYLTYKCLNPSHIDSHPSLKYDTKTQSYCCYPCRDRDKNSAGHDVFTLIAFHKGLDLKSDFTEILNIAISEFSLNVDNTYNKPQPQKTALKPIEPIKIENNAKLKLEELKPEEKSSLNEYIDKARGNIEDKDCIAYLKSRGIENIDLMKKYNMGYSINTYEGNKFPSIITPTSIDSQFLSFTGFTRRQLIPGKTKDGDIIEKGKNGASGIFNLKALYQSEKPVFVCEGEFNALSILEVTSGEIEGVATGSTGNTQTFIDLLKLRRPEAFIILELDDDYKLVLKGDINKGKEAQRKIEEYLKQANISFLSVNTVKACKMPDKNDKSKFIQCKDQNDALTHDRETFINEIEKVLLEVKSIQKKQGENKMTTSTELIKEIKAPEQAGQENKQIDQTKQADNEKDNVINGIDLTKIREHLKRSRLDFDYLQREYNFLESRKNKKYKKTGFDNLDDILGGGLEPGLYLIGAVPGAGKSAFFQQIGENLADQGHNVLYISMEMPGHILTARAVSRILKKEHNLSVSAKDVLNLHKIEDRYTRDRIVEAYEKVCKLQDDEKRGDIYLIDNSEAKSPADFISREKIRYYVESSKYPLREEDECKEKDSPVVIVDYVQILRRLDSETSLDKKSVLDKHMETLKAISMEFDIPVLVISSVNRDSYKDGNTKLTLASLKESGDIEYYAEVVLLIDYDRNYQGYQKDSRFDIEKAKKHAKENRYSVYKIVIAKNRNGGDNESKIYFYGESTYFTEEKPDQKQNIGIAFDKE